MLDWEFAHLGDPSEDLGYCRQFVEPLVSWDAFLDDYYAGGGPEYREQSAQFFELWRGVRNAVCCALGMGGFVTGMNSELRMAHAGFFLYRHFLMDVAENLERLET